MKVMYDGRLVEVRELSHVIGFVELGWIDLVDRFRIHLVLLAIVALYEYLPFG